MLRWRISLGKRMAFGWVGGAACTTRRSGFCFTLKHIFCFEERRRSHPKGRFHFYGARAGDVTPLLAHHLMAAHRRLVPIDHSHSCSPHHCACRDVAGFSRFVRGVKWRHQTLGGKVRGSEDPMDTENHGICVYLSKISIDQYGTTHF